MKHSKLALVLLALATTACGVEITTSSRGLLGPHGSEVAVARSAVAGALEVTRLFEARGYGLVDQHVEGPANQIVLQLKGNRAAVTEGGKHVTFSSQVGSVFYVWITPLTLETSRIAMLGKPTLDGLEPCTDGPRLPCTSILATLDQSVQMSGGDEAEVVHGVFSELALEGYTIAPPPRTAAELAAGAYASCLEQRHRIVWKAAELRDHDEQTRLLWTLPTCKG